MTAKLIKGENLTPDQIKQVKAAFVYRWTNENFTARLQDTLGAAKPETLQTDADWIAERAFYFTKAGRLAAVPKHCEPAYMAE